jgi:hypothetical protein
MCRLRRRTRRSSRKEADLPDSSFVERITIGGEEAAFTNVSSPVIDIVAKRVEKRQVQYLALTATYEAFWLPRAALSLEYGVLSQAFENAERKKKDLPELRTSQRLVDANSVVDEDELHF